MEKTYHGSCHCGSIRFEADVELGAAPVVYEDGKRDRQDRAPEVTSYL